MATVATVAARLQTFQQTYMPWYKPDEWEGLSGNDRFESLVIWYLFNGHFGEDTIVRDTSFPRVVHVDWVPNLLPFFIQFTRALDIDGGISIGDFLVRGKATDVEIGFVCATFTTTDWTGLFGPTYRGGAALWIPVKDVTKFRIDEHGCDPDDVQRLKSYRGRANKEIGKFANKITISAESAQKILDRLYKYSHADWCAGFVYHYLRGCRLVGAALGFES